MIVFRQTLNNTDYVNVFVTASFFSLIDVFFEPVRMHVLWFVKETNQLPRSLFLILFLKPVLLVLGLIIWKVNLLIILFILGAYLWTLSSLFFFISRKESLIPGIALILNVVQIVALFILQDFKVAIKLSLLLNLFFLIYSLVNREVYRLKISRSSGFITYSKPLYLQAILSACKIAIPRFFSFQIGIEFSAFFEFYDRLLKRISKFFDRVYLVFLRDIMGLTINTRIISLLGFLISLAIFSVMSLVYFDDLIEYLLYFLIVSLEAFIVVHGLVETKLRLASGRTKSIAKASFVRFLFTLGVMVFASPLGILLLRLGGSFGYLKVLSYEKADQ